MFRRKFYSTIKHILFPLDMVINNIAAFGSEKNSHMKHQTSKYSRRVTVCSALWSVVLLGFTMSAIGAWLFVARNRGYWCGGYVVPDTRHTFRVTLHVLHKIIKIKKIHVLHEKFRSRIISHYNNLNWFNTFGCFVCFFSEIKQQTCNVGAPKH